MNKNTIITIAVIAIILIAGIAYFSFSDNSLFNAKPSAETSFPVLETNEQVFNEFDNAITGLE